MIDAAAKPNPIDPWCGKGWLRILGNRGLYRSLNVPRHMDTLSEHQRSERMSRVRHRDTKPEIRVRQILYGMGYRYRLQAKDLPGTPDIIFRGRKRVVFVHGCFWHRHDQPNCKLARLPKSRLDFWLPKFERNVGRDRANQTKLSEMGWRFLVVWECELPNRKALESKLRGFLG